jgi:hypothetical protein
VSKGVCNDQARRICWKFQGSGDAVSSVGVADILERELQSLIGDWPYRVEQKADLKGFPLNFEARTGHLPHRLYDVIARLRLDSGESSNFTSCDRAR